MVVAAEPYSVPGTGVVTAQPVTAGTTASANRGCEWLSGYQGLFLRQHIELLEVIGGCETKNTPPPQQWRSFFDYDGGGAGPSKKSGRRFGGGLECA